VQTAFGAAEHEHAGVHVLDFRLEQHTGQPILVHHRPANALGHTQPVEFDLADAVDLQQRRTGLAVDAAERPEQPHRVDTGVVALDGGVPGQVHHAALVRDEHR
jgi:hypothetical protein